MPRGSGVVGRLTAGLHNAWISAPVGSITVAPYAMAGSYLKRLLPLGDPISLERRVPPTTTLLLVFNPSSRRRDSIEPKSLECIRHEGYKFSECVDGTPVWVLAGQLKQGPYTDSELRHGRFHSPITSIHGPTGVTRQNLAPDGLRPCGSTRIGDCGPSPEPCQTEVQDLRSIDHCTCTVWPSAAVTSRIT